jgi:hypothetical protein
MHLTPIGSKIDRGGFVLGFGNRNFSSSVPQLIHDASLRSTRDTGWMIKSRGSQEQNCERPYIFQKHPKSKLANFAGPSLSTICMISMISMNPFVQVGVQCHMGDVPVSWGRWKHRGCAKESWPVQVSFFYSPRSIRLPIDVTVYGSWPASLDCSLLRKLADVKGARLGGRVQSTQKLQFFIFALFVTSPKDVFLTFSICAAARGFEWAQSRNSAQPGPGGMQACPM